MKYLRRSLLVAAFWFFPWSPHLNAGEKLVTPPKGFESIFNGKDLKGWDGSAKYWSVEDGALTGVTDGKLDYNRFIVWRGPLTPDPSPKGRGEKLRNFELRVKVKVTPRGNSGINYRSIERPDLGETVVTGYQCDVVPTRADYNGMLYEERGRRILAHTGEKVIIDKDGQPWVVGTLPVKEFKPDEWHDFRVLVHGNHHQHWIDGHPTVDVIDLDEKGRKLDGVLALQVHVGPPMKIQYKDFFLKRLPDDIALITPEMAKIPPNAVKVVPQGKDKPKKTSKVESVRYLRVAGQGFATECTFTTTRSAEGTSIESVTERVKTKMTVRSVYDAKNLLRTAVATLTIDGKAKSATVVVTDGKAKVKRDALPDQEFDVPQGVIVTSAPDWTDTFLLCQRFDRVKGGKQSFPGLWVHPQQQCQRVDFQIERIGEDAIETADKKQKIDRFSIWLRGKSEYMAWANADGIMIKLAPLPVPANPTNWLVLEGYEKSTLSLRP
jgi:hypothetical protein